MDARREIYLLFKFLRKLKCKDAIFKPSYCLKRESPDFVVKIQNQDVGIELTEFYIKDGGKIDSEQKQEQIRSKIIKEAQDKTTYGNSIYLNFEFNVIADYDKNLKELIEFIDQKNFDFNAFVNPSSFAHLDFLRNIWAEQTAHPRDWSYTHISDLYPTLDQKRLLEVIDGKEEKLKSYDQYE